MSAPAWVGQGDEKNVDDFLMPSRAGKYMRA